MNSDGINRIYLMRSLYKSKEAGSSSAMVRELQDIKNELKIANDENIRKEEPITNATNSPYLTDRPNFKKEVIYGSSAEVEWKQVKSADELEKEREEEFQESNRRKLNIL
jgi:hypothetical protein